MSSLSPVKHLYRKYQKNHPSKTSANIWAFYSFFLYFSRLWPMLLLINTLYLVWQPFLARHLTEQTFYDSWEFFWSSETFVLAPARLGKPTPDELLKLSQKSKLVRLSWSARRGKVRVPPACLGTSVGISTVVAATSAYPGCGVAFPSQFLYLPVPCDLCCSFKTPPPPLLAPLSD